VPLKAIAGTPDFDDWEKIKFKQNQLIESESKQIEINTKSQTSLNDVSRAIKKILKPDAEVEHFSATILAKNRLIITNLEDLILTVTLAKINLISIDIKELSNEQLTNTSITDLLEVSHIKAFQKSELLYFLIKYPKPLLSCKKNRYPSSPA